MLTPRRAQSPCSPPARTQQSNPFGIQPWEEVQTPPAVRRSRQTPLYAALRSGSRGQVREALDADPEAASLPLLEVWESPLLTAAKLGCSAGIMQELIDRGANAKATDMYGTSPLQLLREKRQQAQLAMALPFMPDPWGTQETLDPFADDLKANADVLLAGMKEAEDVLIQAGAESAE
mmetsp:Transcript_6624/g.16230  ORF Transcript_6624/g.16230 Transcript_6624/m.16230 type:complete len:178 (-) Transcript_6624:315-848(-)